MPDEEIEKVKVDKREVRNEIGRSPGLPVDSYAINVHTENADRIYGVQPHVVHGALSYLQQKDPDNYNPNRLTIDQVKKAINQYQAQEYKE